MSLEPDEAIPTAFGTGSRQFGLGPTGARNNTNEQNCGSRIRKNAEIPENLGYSELRPWRAQDRASAERFCHLDADRDDEIFSCFAGSIYPCLEFIARTKCCLRVRDSSRRGGLAFLRSVLFGRCGQLMMPVCARGPRCERRRRERHRGRRRGCSHSSIAHRSGCDCDGWRRSPQL